MPLKIPVSKSTKNTDIKRDEVVTDKRQTHMDTLSVTLKHTHIIKTVILCMMKTSEAEPEYFAKGRVERQARARKMFSRATEVTVVYLWPI